MINAHIVGLDDSLLCPVSAGHFLTSVTAAAFLNMSQAALQDGIHIAIASSYRSFDRQAMIWNRKFRGEAIVYDSNGEPIADWFSLPFRERIFAILRWSALPGASRHHWGTDLDVYAPDLLPAGQKLQLIPAEYDEQNGYFSVLTKWLNENMRQFGFFRPYAFDNGGVAQEPWHLSFYPEAVQFQQQLTTEMLTQVLVTHPLEGQHEILQAIPEIMDRYIMNICKDN